MPARLALTAGRLLRQPADYIMWQTIERQAETIREQAEQIGMLTAENHALEARTAAQPAPAPICRSWSRWWLFWRFWCWSWPACCWHGRGDS
jgi:hypothetical protein